MSSDYLGYSVVSYSEVPEDEVLVLGLTPEVSAHFTALAQIETLWEFRDADHIRPFLRDAIKRAKETRGSRKSVGKIVGL